MIALFLLLGCLPRPSPLGTAYAERTCSLVYSESAGRGCIVDVCRPSGPHLGEDVHWVTVNHGRPTPCERDQGRTCAAELLWAQRVCR